MLEFQFTTNSPLYSKATIRERIKPFSANKNAAFELRIQSDQPCPFEIKK